MFRRRSGSPSVDENEPVFMRRTETVGSLTWNKMRHVYRKTCLLSSSRLRPLMSSSDLQGEKAVSTTPKPSQTSRDIFKFRTVAWMGTQHGCNISHSVLKYCVFRPRCVVTLSASTFSRSSFKYDHWTSIAPQFSFLI